MLGVVEGIEGERESGDVVVVGERGVVEGMSLIPI
jgi:hypothetical protein